MVIRIQNNNNYKQLEEYFKNHNIETRPMFYPLQSFEYLNKLRVNENTTSIKVHNEYVFLPFNSVNEYNIIYICNILKKYIKTI